MARALPTARGPGGELAPVSPRPGPRLHRPVTRAAGTCHPDPGPGPDPVRGEQVELGGWSRSWRWRRHGPWPTPAGPRAGEGGRQAGASPLRSWPGGRGGDRGFRAGAVHPHDIGELACLPARRAGRRPQSSPERTGGGGARMSERRAYRIDGRVQGVGFRWWARQTATELGLRGSVRNSPDGTSGSRPRAPVEGSWTGSRSGSGRARPAARVRSVEPIPAGSAPLPDGFEITRH
jgi:acylphosphatase